MLIFINFKLTIMNRLERIDTFISVVEEGSFAAAARKKGVSTPAVSRQIAALERELRVELLKRTTRHIALTDSGAMYYQECKQALNQLASAEEMLLNSQSEARGTLHIMANRYFANHYLLPKLQEFRQLHPNLYLDIQLAESIPKLDKEGIDILFGVSLEGEQDWVRRKIASTRYVLCASPRYLKTRGTPKSPADLTQHDYITHTSRKPDNIIPFKKGKNSIVKPTLGLNESHAIRECAIQDMGLVNLHDYIVADAIEQGSLIEVLFEYQEPKVDIYLYYQQSRYLQPKIRRFIDFFNN
jgi:DNA-binding transcriptional LysR family regulator